VVYWRTRNIRHFLPKSKFCSERTKNTPRSQNRTSVIRARNVGGTPRESKTKVMVQLPFEMLGTVAKTEGRLTIDIDPTADINFGKSLGDGSVVRMLVWAAKDGQNPVSDLETIANAQQLDLSIVAQGLESEGALWKKRDEFLDRLSLKC
jgi:hypothetical protein